MAATRALPGRSARLQLRAHARFQPVYGHARPDAGVEPLPQRGTREVLGGQRLDGRANPLVGAAVQLHVLLQGNPQALDRGDLHRRRCKGQGRAESVAGRHAGSNAALGAVPRGGFLIARNEVRHADNQAPGHRIQPVQVREMG